MVESQNITISVIGQFKRGKSALVNAILEEGVLIGIETKNDYELIQFFAKQASVYKQLNIIAFPVFLSSSMQSNRDF